MKIVDSEVIFSSYFFIQKKGITFSNSFYGGDKEIRTLDPLRARQVLSQLSYTPKMVDLQGLEPRTYRL